MSGYEGKLSPQGGYNIPRTCGKCYGKYYVDSWLSAQSVTCPHCGYRN